MDFVGGRRRAWQLRRLRIAGEWDQPEIVAGSSAGACGDQEPAVGGPVGSDYAHRVDAGGAQLLARDAGLFNAARSLFFVELQQSGAVGPKDDPLTVGRPNGRRIHA